MTDDIKEYIESGNLSILFAGLYGQVWALATRLAKISHICADLQKPSEEIVVLFDEELPKKTQKPKRGRPRKNDIKN